VINSRHVQTGGGQTDSIRAGHTCSLPQQTHSMRLRRSISGSIDVPVGVAANFTFVRVVACCLTECNASTWGDVDVD
jgi:hypothetical protein